MSCDLGQEHFDTLHEALGAISQNWTPSSVLGNVLNISKLVWNICRRRTSFCKSFMTSVILCVLYGTIFLFIPYILSFKFPFSLENFKLIYCVLIWKKPNILYFQEHYFLIVLPSLFVFNFVVLFYYTSRSFFYRTICFFIVRTEVFYWKYFWNLSIEWIVLVKSK